MCWYVVSSVRVEAYREGRLLNVLCFLFCADERDIVLKLAEASQWTELLKREQLVKEMREGRAFVGLVESPINTAPTYRYHTLSDEWSKVKLYNLPSWTDRVLYRTLGTVPPLKASITEEDDTSSTSTTATTISSSSKPPLGPTKSINYTLGSTAAMSLVAPPRSTTPASELVGIGGLLQLIPHEYRTMMDVYGSDHRPIVHSFTIRFRLPAAPQAVLAATAKAQAAAAAAKAGATATDTKSTAATADTKSGTAVPSAGSAGVAVTATTSPADAAAINTALAHLRTSYPTFAPIATDAATRASSPSIFDATGQLLPTATLPVPSLLQVLIYGWRVSLKGALNAKQSDPNSPPWFEGVRLALFSPYLFTASSTAGGSSGAGGDAGGNGMGMSSAALDVSGGAGGGGDAAANEPNANAIAAAAVMASRHIALYSMIAAPNLVRGAAQVAAMVDFPAQFAAPEVICVALLPLALPIASQHLLHIALISKSSKSPVAYAYIPLNELRTYIYVSEW